jgi:hypothetical protein
LTLEQLSALAVIVLRPKSTIGRTIASLPGFMDPQANADAVRATIETDFSLCIEPPQSDASREIIPRKGTKH